MTGPKEFEDEDHSWRDRAACKGKPISWFFSEGRGVSAMSPEAHELCKTCPVRKDCLNYAIKHNIRDGVWGDMVYRKRRTLRNASPYKGKRSPVRKAS